MASSQSERTLCLIKFYNVPASANKEALAAQLVDMCGGDNMQVVRTWLSEIKVIALMRDPKTTVPVEFNCIVGDRMHQIAVDVTDINSFLQEEQMVRQQAEEALAKYRAIKAKEDASK